MANVIYLSLQGSQQGLISEGCSTQKSIGNSYQLMHEDEIFIYELTSEITREQNVLMQPVEIRKPIDKSTPLLANAISKNEELECLFNFYRSSRGGGMEHYFQLKLVKAKINHIRFYYPNSLTHNDSQPQESVSFVYESVVWEHVAAGTSAWSLWEERIF